MLQQNNVWFRATKFEMLLTHLNRMLSAFAFVRMFVNIQDAVKTLYP